MVTLLCALSVLPSAFPQEAPKNAAPAAPAAVPAVPRDLGEMLSTALRSNPEVLQAEARLQLAQANCNQARLKAMEEVIATFHEREKQEALIASHEEALERIERLMKVQQVDASAANESRRLLTEARAALETANARLRYALGLGGLSSEGIAVGLAGAQQIVAGQKRRELTPVEQELLKKEVPEGLAAKEIPEWFPALSDGRMRVVADDSAIQKLRTLDANQDLHFREMMKASKQTLRSLLEAHADFAGICFVFRDYGVLITTPEKASSMLSPVIPEDTPLRTR